MLYKGKSPFHVSAAPPWKCIAEEHVCNTAGISWGHLLCLHLLNAEETLWFILVSLKYLKNCEKIAGEFRHHYEQSIWEALAILLFSSISLHWPLRKAFLSLLAILWNSGCVFPFLLCILLLFFSQLFVKPPQILDLISIFLCLHWTWPCNPSINCHYACFCCFTRNTKTYKFSV